MATDFTKIKEILGNAGYSYNERDDVIVLGYEGDYQVYVLIRIHEDGEFLSINTQLDDPDGGFLKVPFQEGQPGFEHRLTLMQYLMDSNFKYKIGHWGIDQDDGDIRFISNYHLEDGDLKPKQLIRMIKSIFSTTDEVAPQIVNIIKTGEKQPTDEDKVSNAEEKAKAIQELTAKGTQLLMGNNDKDKENGMKILTLISEGKIDEAEKVVREIERAGI